MRYVVVQLLAQIQLQKSKIVQFKRVKHHQINNLTTYEYKREATNIRTECLSLSR